MAALARGIAEVGAGPLDGLPPDALAAGVRVALGSGFFDELDWLTPGAAGAATYELAAALHVGPEQRELGRRVMARLLEGNAEVFVAIATRMAGGAAKGLLAPAVRARVALVAELPLHLGIADGPLALAILSRRELARDWIVASSTGSLSSRRLAARLVERAAREAAARAAQGDDNALRVFRSELVAGSIGRLLSDRESLVWRHVAVARGLLAPYVPTLVEEIDAALLPSLTPTEWRRAATSLAAQLAVSPEAGLARVRHALSAGLLVRDPGGVGAFVWGLARAAESEPEAAWELFETIAKEPSLELGEAVVELTRELGPMAFSEQAAQKVARLLASFPARPGDDGADALREDVMRDLERSSTDPTLRDQVGDALLAFVNDGSRAAYGAAKRVLESAQEALVALRAIGDDDEQVGRAGWLARRSSFSVLRDLDIALLERGTLTNLVHLGASAEARIHDEALESLREKLAEWILEREGEPLSLPPEAGLGERMGRPSLIIEPLHPTLRLRRLRALLHLVDGDVSEASGEAPTRHRVRWQTIARALVTRFERDPRSVLRRTIMAALARAVDALVRARACDAVDVLLVSAQRVEDPAEFATLAEASMDPDLVPLLSRYSAFCLSVICAQAMDQELAALGELAREMSTESSSRAEALQAALTKLHAALERVASASSLRALCSGGDEPDAVIALEAALSQLSQLAAGARARVTPSSAGAHAHAPPSRGLSVAVSRVLSGADARLSAHVVSSSIDELLAGVPRTVARVASRAIALLADRPADRPSAPNDSGSMRVLDQLPGWLPPRRTLGGFFVLRAIGAGGVGTVFVATRVEDRHDPDAERFALKVPDYSVTAAQRLSEAEFFALFRAEASALMALPEHPNLARFVTFDAGARPKPILVMELVEGVTLEHVLAARGLDLARAFTTLDEVLAGLEAMHDAGVGHLDLKPSNVVLRRGKEAVLVDFGLAGRHIRPGCATGGYGAPEIWTAHAPRGGDAPKHADVYAFGCLAFEVLTGKALFDAPNEMAQIALHLAHDGFPPPLRELAQKPALQALAEVLFSALRRDPAARAPVAELRAALRRVRGTLARKAWPLD
jgi:hypothetical protein